MVTDFSSSDLELITFCLTFVFVLPHRAGKPSTLGPTLAAVFYKWEAVAPSQKAPLCLLQAL